jgi:hypothetical protein
MLLELFLKYYFYPGQRGYLISSYYDDLNIRNDYTVTAKKRIFDILKGKKTKDEYNAWLLYRKSIPENFNSCKRIAEQIMRKRKIQDDTIIKKLTDSIYAENMTKDTKERVQSEQIKPDMILMTGFLNMKECFPTLKEKLEEYVIENAKRKNEREHGISIWTGELDHEQSCRFALAKLGDKTQYQYILDTFIPDYYFDRKFLSYFRDDDITWKYIDINYSPDKTIQILSDGGIPMTLYCMDVILPFVKNAPKELHNPFWTSKTDEENYKWAESLYAWIMKNRENIEFDYNVKKGWFWSGL